MGEAAIIACQPKPLTENETRHSNNFCVNQLPHLKYLRWSIITLTEGDNNICFHVKEHHACREDALRFEDIRHGAITPYFAYRNLYISEVRNATGHFIVRVEACNEEE